MNKSPLALRHTLCYPSLWAISPFVSSCGFRLMAQIIISLDSVGNLRCEAPGLNGMRKKITLPCDFAFNNPTIMAELKTQLAVERTKASAPSAATTRVDPQIEREKRIEKARADHLREWTERFNNGTDVEREIMLYRKERAEEKSQERQAKLARDIYLQAAKDHGINLANRVITDPRRRPNRTIHLTNGTDYNPRSERNNGSKTKTRSYGNAKALDLII